MDESLMRRGKPASHRIYGLPLALNTGDLLFAKAYQIVSKRKDINPDIRLRIMDLLSEMSVRTVEGQAQELGWIENNIWDLNIKDYLRIVNLKTEGTTQQ